MRVVVTGATGNVGTAVLRALTPTPTSMRSSGSRAERRDGDWAAPHSSVPTSPQIGWSRFSPVPTSSSTSPG